jgi:hypothetical protein
MATSLIIRANLVDADVAYATTPADYITLDLANDYMIWSEDLEDLMTHEPTSDELNEHAVIIEDDANKTVPECLIMDYSYDWGGSYYTHLVIGMGLNKRYVYCFSFDGATAIEPQLEAWDDDTHTTTVKHVLGAGVPANSMIKAVCTTGALPGASWVGTAIAGSNSARVVKLNDGNGALTIAKHLYANMKIVIPMAYATPAIESFTLCVRYTWQ